MSSVISNVYKKLCENKAMALLNKMPYREEAIVKMGGLDPCEMTLILYHALGKFSRWQIDDTYFFF